MSFRLPGGQPCRRTPQYGGQGLPAIIRFDDERDAQFGEPSLGHVPGPDDWRLLPASMRMAVQQQRRPTCPRLALASGAGPCA
jgi:hypothetical protein